MAVTLTPAAIDRVVAIRTKEGWQDRWLKLGVRGGGCSGFSYVMDFVEGPAEKDKTFDFDKSVKVCVDAKSYMFLNGVELDFEQDLISTRFIFRNPHADTTCSCGESFSI